MMYMLLSFIGCQETVKAQTIKEIKEAHAIPVLVDKNNRLTAEFVVLQMEELRRNNMNSGNFTDLDSIDDNKEKLKEAEKQQETLVKAMEPLFEKIKAKINIELTEEAQKNVTTTATAAEKCTIGFGFGWRVVCKFDAKLKKKLKSSQKLTATCFKGDTVVYADPSANIPYKAKKGRDFEMTVSTIESCWYRGADKLLIDVVKWR